MQTQGGQLRSISPVGVPAIRDPVVGWRLGREEPRIGVTLKTGPEAERRCHVGSPAARRRPDSQSSRLSAFRIKLRSEITTGVMARSRERLTPSLRCLSD
jgi:hypothetical protein